MSSVEPNPDGASSTSGAGHDAVLLAVNGVVREVRGAAAFGTLSTFLRQDLRLTGTKIVCSEGDCGACSVLVGEFDEAAASFNYRAVDSCIAFVYQLHRCHIITVDGLASRRNAQSVDELHPVQRAMAENYGSQCGFCTPGFVVAMTDLVASAQRRGVAPDVPEIRTALSGNLCRCTGYVQILDAVAAVDLSDVPAPSQLFNEEPLVKAFTTVDTNLELHHEGSSVVVPDSERRALEAKARKPEARVVAGATDLGVRFNKGELDEGDWLHLASSEGTAMGGFSETRWREDRRELTLGATTRWSAVRRAVEGLVPEFAEIVDRFGGPQIRNMGTIGGNLVNASPIADSLPFLYVAQAQLDLASVSGHRSLAIQDFYLDYKTLDLKPTELLRSVRFAVPDAARGERVLLLKASRRRDLDISTFTAALWLRVEEERVGEARIAYGGVGPVVLRLPEAERSLVGRRVHRAAFAAAGEAAQKEISPISDVRGDASYRSLLAVNVMLRFFEQLTVNSGDAP